MRSGAAGVHPASVVGGRRRDSDHPPSPLWRAPVSQARHRGIRAACSSIRSGRDGREFSVLGHSWSINRIFLQALRSTYRLTGPPLSPRWQLVRDELSRLTLYPKADILPLRSQCRDGRSRTLRISTKVT